MAKALKTTLADKLKTKRVRKKKVVSKGSQYQSEIKTRSGFETKVVDLFNKHKVEFDYENKERRLDYTVPAKNCRYLPDFIVRCKTTGQEYFIETKGRFVELSERMKYLYIQEQKLKRHPFIEIDGWTYAAREVGEWLGLNVHQAYELVIS